MLNSLQQWFLGSSSSPSYLLKISFDMFFAKTSTKIFDGCNVLDCNLLVATYRLLLSSSSTIKHLFRLKLFDNYELDDSISTGLFLSFPLSGGILSLGKTLLGPCPRNHSPLKDLINFVALSMSSFEIFQWE